MPSVLAANQKGCVRVVVGVVVERGLLVCALFCYLSPATNPASASSPVTPGTSSLSTAKRGTRPLSSAAHKLNHPQLSKACQPCTPSPPPEPQRRHSIPRRRRSQTCAAIHIPRRHPNRTRTAPLGHRNQPCCRAVTPPQPSHTLHLSQARDSTFKGGRTLHLSLITVPSLTHLPEPALERYIHLSVNLYPGSYR